MNAFLGGFPTSLAGLATSVLALVGCCAVAWWDVNDSTYALSVAAFVWTVLVLVSQRHRERQDAIRDKAMHLKLDELIHAIREADDSVAGIEEQLTEEEEKTGG